MNLSKENMELRNVIASVTNSSIEFGSTSNATMLDIFILTEMVQTGTSVDTTL